MSSSNFKKATYMIVFLTVSAISAIAQPEWQIVGQRAFSSDQANDLEIHNYSGTPLVSFTEPNFHVGPCNNPPCLPQHTVNVETFNGVSWDSIGVPTPGRAYYMTTAIHNGTIYGVYLDDAKGGLTAVRFNGSAWDTIGKRGFTQSANGPSIAFKGDTIFVAFYDKNSIGGTSSGGASCMKFDGSNWVYVGPRNLSGRSVVFNDTKLVVYQDTLHVLYSGTNQRYYVKKYDGANWVTVRSGGNLTFAEDLAVNDGNLYVTYSTGSGGQVVRKSEFSNSFTLLGGGDFSLGSISSAAIAFNDTIPYVVYRANSGSKANVRKYNGTNWQTVGAANFSPTAAWVPDIMFIDSIPYVSFRDGGAQFATVMKYDELPCSLDSVVLGNQTACNNDLYTQDLTVHYIRQPSIGTLVANGQHFPITGSPQTITITNLTADGNPVDVDVRFSTDTLCSFTQVGMFNAPPACVVPCVPVNVEITASAMNTSTWGPAVADPYTFFFGLTQWKGLKATVTGNISNSQFTWGTIGSGQIKPWGASPSRKYLFQPLANCKVYVNVTDPNSGCVYGDTVDFIWNDNYFCGTITPNLITYGVRICENGTSKCDTWKSAITKLKANNATLGDCGPSKTSTIESDNEQINIFPNPSNGQFSLEYWSELEGLNHIKIYNINGSVVFSKRFHFPKGKQRIDLNLQELSTGIYMIHLNSGTNTHVERIVINK